MMSPVLTEVFFEFKTPSIANCPITKKVPLVKNCDCGSTVELSDPPKIFLHFGTIFIDQSPVEVFRTGSVVFSGLCKRCKKPCLSVIDPSDQRSISLLVSQALSRVTPGGND